MLFWLSITPSLFQTAVVGGSPEVTQFKMVEIGPMSNSMDTKEPFTVGSCIGTTFSLLFPMCKLLGSMQSLLHTCETYLTETIKETRLDTHVEAYMTLVDMNDLMALQCEFWKIPICNDCASPVSSETTHVYTPSWLVIRGSTSERFANG